MPTVPLSNGGYVLVDEEDVELVRGYSWYGVADGNTRYAYANTRHPETGRPTTIKMHRLILGAGPGQRVDHVNRQGWDNRRSNLRLATPAENGRNSRTRAGGSSKYRGVYAYGDRWRAQIRLDGRRKSLGYFDDELEAAKAYDRAAREHGMFATLNFPDMGEAPHPEG